MARKIASNLQIQKYYLNLLKYLNFNQISYIFRVLMSKKESRFEIANPYDSITASNHNQKTIDSNSGVIKSGGKQNKVQPNSILPPINQSPAKRRQVIAGLQEMQLNASMDHNGSMEYSEPFEFGDQDIQATNGTKVGSRNKSQNELGSTQTLSKQMTLKEIETEHSKRRYDIFRQQRQELYYERGIQKTFNATSKDKNKNNQEGFVQASQNQANYLKKFGVNFEIPSILVKGSQFYPDDPQYSVQLTNYIIPGANRRSHESSSSDTSGSDCQNSDEDDDFLGIDQGIYDLYNYDEFGYLDPKYHGVVVQDDKQKNETNMFNQTEQGTERKFNTHLQGAWQDTKTKTFYEGEQILFKSDSTWEVKDQVKEGKVIMKLSTAPKGIPEIDAIITLEHKDDKFNLRFININTIEVTQLSDKSKFTLSRCLEKRGYIDIYQEYTQGIQLKLIRKDTKETSAEIVSSITLGLESKKVVTNALVKFSTGPKSKFLALYLKELKSLRILKIEEDEDSEVDGRNTMKSQRAHLKKNVELKEDNMGALDEESKQGIQRTFRKFVKAQDKVRKELRDLMKPKKEDYDKTNALQKEEMAEKRRKLKESKEDMKNSYKKTFYLVKSYNKKDDQMKQEDDKKQQENDNPFKPEYGNKKLSPQQLGPKRNHIFNQMDFFNQDKFIVLSNKYMVEIIDLESVDTTKTKANSLILTLQKLNKINQRKLYETDQMNMLEYDFDLICDIRLKKISKKEFKLQIACRIQGIKQIEVIEIENWYDFDEKKFKILESDVNQFGIYVAKKSRILQFHGEINDDIMVKISQDFDQVVLVNGNESYLCEKQHNHECENHYNKEGDYSKDKNQITRMIPQLHGKQIEFVYPDDEGGFFFVAFYPYDQSIDIIHSSMDQFEVEFHRKIEPNIIKVFDMSLKLDPKTNKYILRLASSRDNGFALDTATYDEANQLTHCQSKYSISNKESIMYETDEFQAIQAFHARWPYITFAGLDKTMLLIFSAFTSEVIRLKIPNDPSRILYTYITEHYDLYILCQKEDKYYLSVVNLDECNPNEYKDIFKRTCKNKTILEYVSKDVDYKPFVAMHVRGESSKDVIDNNEKAIVYLLHQDMLYSWKLQHLKDNKPKECGQTLSRNFYPLNDANFFLLAGNDTSMTIAQYTCGFSSVEKRAVHEVLLSNERIINFNVDTSSQKLLIFSKMVKLPDGNNNKITVYDLAQKKVIFDLVVREMHLCGRLESGLYTLIDGHIYYNNDVIKMRYDLIEQPKSIKYQENEIFDYYENIFIMKEGQKIMANCPINSMSFHKFIYVIKSPVSLRATKIVIMPYLHEKRIYLNRPKKFTDYFYTSIDLKDIKKNKDFTLKRVKQIVCVNLSEYKYYIYSLRGLLRNRVDFKHIIQKYGRLQAVSQNGQNFVLFKTRLDLEDASVSIFHLTNRDFYFIKKIDIMKQMKDYAKRLQQSVSEDEKQQQERKGTGTYINYLIEHNPWIKTYKAHFEFSINNHFDVCIKMSKKNVRPSFYNNSGTHGYIRYKFEAMIADKMDFSIGKIYNELEAKLAQEKDRNNTPLSSADQKQQQQRKSKFKTEANEISNLNDSQLGLIKEFVIQQKEKEGMPLIPHQPEGNESDTQEKQSDSKKKFYQIAFPDPRLDFDTLFYFQAGRYQPGRRMEYEFKQKSNERSKSVVHKKAEKLGNDIRSKSQNFDRYLKVSDEVTNNQQSHKNVPRDIKKQVNQMMRKRVIYGQDKKPLEPKPLIEQQFFYFQDDSRQSYLLNTDNWALKQKEYKKPTLKDLGLLSQKNKIESFDKCRNFKMNDEYVIFWDSKIIWTIALLAEKVLEEKVGFEIKNKDLSKKIIDVRTGSNPRIIAIIVENAQNEQCIITYDLDKKKQKALFDVAKEEYELLWDSDGIPYIVQEDKTIFTKQKSIMMCHEANDLKQIKKMNQNYKQIALQAGHRVDGKDHNWMMLNQYISLSFSFMTFVIKQKIEISDERQKQNIFDPTPYNYLIDRRGPFIDSSFVKDDHEELAHVLKQLHILNPQYIDQLMYTKTDLVRQPGILGKYVNQRCTPLHVACQAENNRSMDIILNYMSLSKIKHTKPFSDIIKDLVDHSAFSNYFAKCQEQNILMEDKLILKVKTAYKPGRIAKLAESTTLFLDDEFYRTHMKDQQSKGQMNTEYEQSYSCIRESVESYSVDVRALRIDWVFTESGKEFLNEIYDTDDLDLFANPSIEMMVEFIFKKLKPLRNFCLAFILVQFLALFATMLFADSRVYVKNREEVELCQHYEEGEDDGDCPDYDWQYNPAMDKYTAICGVVNFILNTFQLYMYLKEYRKSVFDMVFRWKLVDLVYILLNYVLCILHIGHFGVFWLLERKVISYFMPQGQSIANEIEKNNAVEDTTLMWERYIFTCIVLCMCVRLLNYLKLYTWFSQHIEIFIDIMEVIIPFSFMIVLMIITFAIAFYMLGRNQIQYKNKVNPAKEPDYATFQGALWEIFNVCMGNPGFSVGDYHEDAFFLNHEATLVGACLLIVYVIACFILLLNLLNMLIAIMSDAFAENTEKIEQIKISARLCFILDKWAFKEYRGMIKVDSGEKDGKRGKVAGIKYVVCAFMQEQDKNNTNLIKQLQNDIKECNTKIGNNQNDMFIGQKEMRSNQREMVRDIKTEFMKELKSMREEMKETNSLLKNRQ